MANYDKELQQFVEEIRETSTPIQSHHYVWMIETVISEFEKKLIKTEQDLIRHQTFVGDTRPFTSLSESRHELIKSLDASREEYLSILKFLYAVSRWANMKSAIQFTNEIADFFHPKKK